MLLGLFKAGVGLVVNVTTSPVHAIKLDTDVLPGMFSLTCFLTAHEHGTFDVEAWSTHADDFLPAESLVFFSIANCRPWLKVFSYNLLGLFEACDIVGEVGITTIEVIVINLDNRVISRASVDFCSVHVLRYVGQGGWLTHFGRILSVV